MAFSQFGDKFTRHSGITRLMEDLGEGLRTPGAIMLGGGNPAQIPAINDYFSQLLLQMHQDGKLNRSAVQLRRPARQSAAAGGAGYAAARGARLAGDEPQNIALTNGSQSAFFYLFNLFAGRRADGSTKNACCSRWHRNISAMPMPGWRRICSSPPNRTLSCCRKASSNITSILNTCILDEETGMICVSRPTNPTGNVITDDELMKLDALAQQHGIPLVIDNAYGVPFPGIIFSEARPLWNPNTILCMSLSKLGLPGSRCGIIIANEKIITAITNMNGIISLSPGGIGPAMMPPK